MASNDWTPKEPASVISTEHYLLIGQFLSTVGFGVQFTLFIWCFNLLYFKKKTRTDWIFLVYICTLFILSNIGTAAAIKFTSMSFIDYRDHPGGPAAFFVDQGFLPVSHLFNVTFVINNWLQDGLILYRFGVIYSGSWCLFALPATLFVAAVVVAIIVFVQWNHGITVEMKGTINMAVTFWSLSAAVNVILVVLIAGRLLHMRRRLRRLLGTVNSDYLSITTMLVESAAIYALNALWAIIPYALGHPSHHLAVPLMGQTAAIAPLLVILRVAQRRAWTKNTMANLTDTVNRVSVLEFHHSQDVDTFQGHPQSQESITDMGSTLDNNQPQDSGEKSPGSSGGPTTKVQIQVASMDVV